jgi:hypothetical protein
MAYKDDVFQGVEKRSVCYSIQEVCAEEEAVAGEYASAHMLHASYLYCTWANHV